MNYRHLTLLVKTSAVLEITNPVGGVMGVIQTQQLSNIVFGTNTSQWQLSGTYTVLVQIGTCNTAQTTFQFTGLSGNISNPPPNQQPLPIPIPQAANEIDMTPGAGSSASAPCVAVNNCFTPNPLNIPPGTTVTWKNTDTISHYVSSGKSTDATTGTIFDSGNLIKPQGTYQFTFANAGTFNYFCTVHPWMTGQVIVGSRVQSPPTQPTPQSPSPQPNPQQSSPPTVSPSEPPVTPSLLVNKFAQTIQVGDEPMGIAYDSVKGEIFVANGGNGNGNRSVSVINDATNTVVSTIPLGSSAYVAYDSGKGEIFVTSTNSIGTGTVSVINDVTNTVVSTIPLGGQPNAVAYDSGKGEIFVTSTNSIGTGTVSVINDVTNTVVSTIPLGGQPNAVAYDSGKGEIFVTSTNSIGTGTVSVINDVTNTVVSTIPLGGQPNAVAYDSGKGEIFVANSFANTISVISDKTNTVIATVPVGLFPMDIAYDSTKGEVFVTVPNGIAVISDATNQIINPQTNTAVIPPTNTQIVQPTNPQPTSVFTPTQQDIQSINQAKASQTIAAEVNVGASQSTTTSIDSNVTVQTTSNTPDSLNVNVSAPSQTGPKVIAFNLNTTTVNVANLNQLGVMYDGKLIPPASNMDAILHAKPTDSPSFAIVVTQSGVQVLVLVPHFSTHTITIMNMSQIMAPTVPEFSFATIILVIATFSIVFIPKIRR